MEPLNKMRSITTNHEADRPFIEGREGEGLRNIESPIYEQRGQDQRGHIR